MPAVPYAQVQASIAGGGNVSGGLTATLGQTCQLSGVNTSQWTSQLWEIYEYPTNFALPAGWTNVGGSYQHTSVTPSVFTMTPWGKYFVRLTVNQGLLNGVLAPSGSVQPLIDTTTAISVLSPGGLIDLGSQETNQFDAVRQWMGALKADLRILDLSQEVIGQRLANDFTTTLNTAVSTNLTFPVQAGDIWGLWFEGTAQCNNTGGVKYALAAPASTAIDGWVKSSTSTIANVSYQRLTTVNALISTALHTIASTPGPDEIRAAIFMANAGTVAIQAASVTASQTTTIFAGATLRARKLVSV